MAGPADQAGEVRQLRRITSNPNRRPAQPGRRRSSERSLEIPPPQEFSAKGLAKPIRLSQPMCTSIGRVFPLCVGLGWRVETRPGSLEFAHVTTRPLYCARHHSPLVTGQTRTAYFEGEIRPGNGEDRVRLALGFVAGRGRGSLMPGSEHGSIGIHFRDRGLYVNQRLLVNAVFQPGEQIGMGMRFSKGHASALEGRVFGSPANPPPAIVVEVFLTRDGRKAGCWNLSDWSEPGSLQFEGLEGNHDLYAAVGTLKEVNVDIFFDESGWRYDPTKWWTLQ